MVFTSLALALLAVGYLWVLIDAIRHPRSDWEAIGRSKVLWIVLILLTWIAAIVYLLVPRPSLRAQASVQRHRPPGAFLSWVPVGVLRLLAPIAPRLAGAPPPPSPSGRAPSAVRGALGATRRSPR